MRVLIVGAGIAGLTLAALLRQRGLAPDIVERALAHDHQNHVLGLYPFGSRVLHGLGVHRSFAAISEVPKSSNEPRMLARSDLLRLLERAAPSDRLRMGVWVGAITETPACVTVRMSDGRGRDYDLVVGADGANSYLRNLISPKADIYDTRWDCWSWWAPRDAGAPREISHGTRAVGLYATPGKLGIVASAPKRRFGNAPDSRRLTKLFSHFDDMAGGALSSAPEAENMFHWPLADSRAREWRRGRVVLLGDAACAFLPTSGIGASMAMESASVLADELSRTDAARIPEALAFYETRRRAHVEAAHDETRRLAKKIYRRSTLFSRPRRDLPSRELAALVAKMSGGPV